MALGKTHDGINLFVGMIITGFLIGFGFGVFSWPSFIIGWLFSTLLFSPDTDLMPKKRSGLLQFFLYPYSIIFKHRGLSHGLLLGTLTRVTYGIILGGILVFVLSKMGYLAIEAEGYWRGLFEFVSEYSYQQPIYKSVTWLYLGLASADACHIFIDKLSSMFTKLKRNY